MCIHVGGLNIDSIMARSIALEWPKYRVCLMADETNVKILLICRIFIMLELNRISI